MREMSDRHASHAGPFKSTSIMAILAAATLITGCGNSMSTSSSTTAPTSASVTTATSAAANATATTASPSPALANASDLSQPPNVGDAKNVATEYHDGGAYDADLTAATAPADAWVKAEAPKVKKPAVVFDIDDTALSNWEVIKADDFGRVINGPCAALPEGPCGWRSWDLESHSTVIKQTLAVYNDARAAGAAIFFITGRDEGQRAATVKNLQDAGYGTYAGLIMPAVGAKYSSAADFKAPQRAQIEKDGYTIIANIGDQPSDLAGGHAEKTFQLPNPFYRIP